MRPDTNPQDSAATQAGIEDLSRPVASTRGIPLSLQILGWFFLNLLLVAAVAIVLFTTEADPLLKALISGGAGDRLEAIAADLAERLAPMPRARWTELLTSVSKRYHVSFALVRREGDAIAGSIPQPPESVLTKIKEFPGPPRPAPPPPPDSENEPPAPREHPPLSNFRFLVREGNLYWAGVRLPSPSDPARARGPVTLVMVSNSLLSGGLLLDTTTLWSVLALLFGSALFWIPLVRRITSPLRTMRDAAQNMARGRFDTRVHIHRGDEIGSLANSLNHLGGRLEEFVTGQKRFLGDIAHELGSPLARMQFALGIAEQNASPTLAPLLEDVREEVGHMSELLGEILQFTRAGLHTELHIESVPLLELVKEAMAREGMPPQSAQLQLPPELCVRADRHFLLRAAANIIRNANRYAGDAGPLLIEARRTSAEVFLSFSDEGPGVPEQMIHRLCDPFFRTEPARSRETGGVGLGLAIVKRCVEACGGSVFIRNRKPHGLTVELRLPLAT